MTTSQQQHLIDWIKNGDKSAHVEFTEGPERQIAYAIEAKIDNLEALLREARIALNDISNLNYIDKNSDTTAYHLAINAIGKINAGLEDKL